MNNISNHDLNKMKIISDAIFEGRCVLFAGSGISLSYTYNDIYYRGAPSVKELLQFLNEQSDAITSDMNLEKGFSIYESIFNRQKVVEFIYDHIPDGKFNDPLPIHKEIIKLPFSAIITTNWDEYFEEAFRESKKDFHTINKDLDLSLYRPRHFPLIKLHGSRGSDSNDIIATEKDMAEFSENKPLIEKYLQVLCANRIILFLGYSLNDSNFRRLYFQVRKYLKELSHLCYAVQLNTSDEIKESWKIHDIDIINMDCTLFIKQLSETMIYHNKSSLVNTGYNEDFLKDPISTHLIIAGSLSSESRVVDEFISRIITLLKDKSLSVNNIYEHCNNAINVLVNSRPHYEALIKLQNKILPNCFNKSRNARNYAIKSLNKLQEYRFNSKTRIAKRGLKFINNNDNIILFAQSTRVIAVIQYFLNIHFNSHLNLYICECRPKSSEPFQDAIEYAKDFHNTNTKITFVPDTAIPQLFSTGIINKIFIGAHSIEQTSNSMLLTNATGISIIAHHATLYDTPIYVFCEEEKIFASNLNNNTTTVTPEVIHQHIPELKDLIETGRAKIFDKPYEIISSIDTPFIVVTDKKTYK